MAGNQTIEQSQHKTKNMKKYIRTILITLLSVSVIAGCKKSTPNDYASSIKNKTWWGQLTYTGKTSEYYSVQFGADNSLIWSQMSGDYPGNWFVEGKTITITFRDNSVQIKADISDDDKLMNITDNTGNSEINSGQLIVNPNISLENTVWKGSLVYAVTPDDYQLSFMPDSKVQSKYFNINYTENYTRSASGAV